MNKLLVILTLALALCGCQHRQPQSLHTVPVIVQAVPTRSFLVTGKITAVEFVPAVNNDQGETTAHTTVHMVLNTGQELTLAFPDFDLTKEFTVGKETTIFFSGSFFQAKLISVN